MSVMQASIPAAGKRRGLIEGAWAFLGQFGSGLILLAGTRLMTELVPPAVFGQVALFNGLVGLGVTVLAYPLVSAGIRLLPEYQLLGTQRLLIGGLRRLMGRAILIASGVLAAGATAWVWLGKAEPAPFLAAGLLLVVTLRRELGIHLLIGQRRQREASLWQTADSLLRPGLAILLVWWAGAEVSLVLLGYGLAGLLANGLGRRYHGAPDLRRDDEGAARGIDRDILRYALPLVPMEMLSWFNALGDRYVIGYFLGPEAVGFYAAAYTLTNEAFHRAAIVLLRTFQPAYFAHHSAGRYRLAFRTFALWTLAVTGLGLAGVAALFPLKDWVAALLLAPVYRGAAELMPVIGVGCALQALATVMAQPIYARKTTRRLLLGRMAGALAAAVSLPLLVQTRGLMGAALAAPIYFGVEAVAMLAVATAQGPRRHRPFPNPPLQKGAGGISSENQNRPR